MGDSKNDSKRNNSAALKKVKSKHVESRYMEGESASQSTRKLVLQSTASVGCSSHSTLPSFGDVSRLNPDSSNQGASSSVRPRNPKYQCPKKRYIKQTKEAMQARNKEIYDEEYFKCTRSLYVCSELKQIIKEKKEFLLEKMKLLDLEIETADRRITILKEKQAFLEEMDEFKDFFSNYLKDAMEEVEKVMKRSTELYEAVKISQDKLSLKDVEPTNAESLLASLKNFDEKTKDARDLLNHVSGEASDYTLLRLLLHYSFSEVKEGLKRFRENGKVIEALYLRKAGLEGFEQS